MCVLLKDHKVLSPPLCKWDKPLQRLSLYSLSCNIVLCLNAGCHDRPEMSECRVG